jgi:very-short-patch-repair endonuclease
MGEAEPGVRTHFPNSLSLKGRGTAAQRQGEGTAVRGVTPKPLLEHAREMRKIRTEAEEKLWAKLRAKRFHSMKFRNQVPFSGDYIADFVCPSAKLIIELDGSQHADQKHYDEKRTLFFEQQGYSVLRFWNNNVLHNIEGVLEAILAAIMQSPLPARCASFPSPLQGEGG